MKILLKFLAVCVFAVLPAAYAVAAETAGGGQDLYEYNNLIAGLETSGMPLVTERYVVFTHKAGPRFVGIAFDFENYKVIHPYQAHVNRSADGKITGSVLFYALERPKNLSELSYRVIIDGLWTADPDNPDKEYDGENGITVSKLDLGGSLPEVTYEKENSGVKFIYNGERGEQVRLAGTFTNWDSWIYELKETKPGFYELTLPLPRGKYYYNYYLGMTAVVDKTNPNKVYTQDGRAASVIEVR
ncbi:MAG: glycogen-binding domain-containing protein [Treponema sp.]